MSYWQVKCACETIKREVVSLLDQFRGAGHSTSSAPQRRSPLFTSAQKQHSPVIRHGIRDLVHECRGTILKHKLLSLTVHWHQRVLLQHIVHEPEGHAGCSAVDRARHGKRTCCTCERCTGDYFDNVDDCITASNRDWCRENRSERQACRSKGDE